MYDELEYEVVLGKVWPKETQWKYSMQNTIFSLRMQPRKLKILPNILSTNCKNG